MSSPRQRIVLATRNAGKRAEIRAALAGAPVDVCPLSDWPGIPEAPEEGESFGENAASKAIQYSLATGLWCLADDSGLVVDALNGAPGVRSARYAGDYSPGTDKRTIDRINNTRLLAALADVPDHRRTARFVCSLALADNERILLTAEGTVEGRILSQGRGDNGFGYDPLFFLPELNRTAAELTRQEKNRISHRGAAVRAFAEQLDRLLS